MEKIKEIDYLRGLATLFVLLIHITSTYISYPQNSAVYLIGGSFNCALTFAVPAFLFISALVMTYQLKNKEKINWLKFIGKRIVKVLSALILWSIIYIICWGNLQNITLKNIISYLVLGNASYHLYFIPLIIQLYLIFPIIWMIAGFTKKIKVNTVLSFILCFIISAVLQYSFTTIFRLNIFKTFIYFSTIIFSYTLPIAMGTWIGFNYSKVKNFFNKYFITFLLLGTVIACIYYVKVEFINYTYKTTLLFSPFYWVLIILSLTYLLRYIKSCPFLEEISKKSFIIYLVHPLILNIVNNHINFSIINSTFFNYLINIALKFIIILSISYLISLIWYSFTNLGKKTGKQLYK